MAKRDRIQAARESSDFNLSFLDIMACGLGAVILIFLLIKHNDDRGVVESDLLSKELETLEQDVQNLRVLVEESAERNSQVRKLGDELDSQSQSSKTVLASIDDRLSEQRNENAQLNQAIKTAEEKEAEDAIAGPAGGEENYLLGLKVEGERIAILVDRSGSMTAERLVDVFRFKVSSATERGGAPKWQRAKRTVRWLLNRVPQQSFVTVVGFGEQAQVLSSVGSSSGGGWFKLGDQATLTDTLSKVNGLVPEGATNLESAFEALAKLSPAPTNVYVITDGLPTKVSGNGRRCARGATITPECRLGLFEDMTRSVSGQLARMRLNVVLLPLEGDWAASNAYWNLAVATGGLMISPPRTWP